MACEVDAIALAERDFLTGLCNRYCFEKAGQKALTEAGSPCALVLVDLDRFGAVNETLGYTSGDAVLGKVAERLKGAAEQRGLVGRLGADEFAILLERARQPEVAELSAKIIDLLSRTYLVDGELVNLGASVGVAFAEHADLQYGDILRRANLALRQAQRAGGGSVSFFTAELEDEAQARRRTELDLRRAIALRQLELYYQPQISMKDRRLIGFEALVRWQHPHRGLLPPGEFLAQAEEIGLMTALGDWVLRTACSEAAGWPQELVVAVNAAPSQFENGRFAGSVRRALEAAKLAGSRLEIEITEGTLLRDREQVVATLQTVRALGVRIAMDDFGTGYASLSQLARFHFDKIKIDRSLAGVVEEDQKCRAIVRAITSLSTSLGVAVMAEGVETQEQLERVQLDGCESVQGYVFSRPVPSSEVKRVIAEFRPEEDTVSRSHRRRAHGYQPL